VIHPLKDSRRKELPQENNLYCPKIGKGSKKYRIKKGKCGSRNSLARSGRNSLNKPNPRMNARMISRSQNGDILRKDQFSSVYETSFNENRPGFQPKEARMNLDNVRQIEDMKEIKKKFSYAEKVARINGFSRNAFG